MKSSSVFTAVAVLLGIVGISVGLSDRQRIESLRIEHQQLVVKAQGLGIALDGSGQPLGPARERRERDDRAEVARRVARDVIASAQVPRPADDEKAAADRRQLALLEPLTGLDTAQLKIFITEIFAAESLDETARRGLASIALVRLNRLDSRATLDLAAQFGEVIEELKIGEPVRQAVYLLSREDPSAAFDWALKQMTRQPSLVSDHMKQDIVAGLAGENPGRAFQAISELGVPNTSRTFSGIFNAARTPADKKSTLALFHQQLATIDNAQEQETATRQVLSGLGSSLSQREFEASAEWREILSPEETEAFVQGLNHNRIQDLGKWIGWIADGPVSESRREHVVRNLMGDWIRQDAVAAGKWLAQAPDDAAKVPAVQTYIREITPLEPQTAIQWALTLPEGEARQESLRSIQRHWPAEDAAGQAAFAKQYGVEGD